MVLREIHVQVLKLFRTYTQHTEGKLLPSVNSCKHQDPHGRRSIILQAYLQNIKKENYFCIAFYLGLIIPTGSTIGSSVVPHHILPEPTKDHASLPAGRLNYFMPYRNILFCTLSFMSEVHRLICQIYYIQGLLKSKSQCNRKLVVTSHKSWATVGGASFVPSLVALPWIKPPMDFNKIGISKGLVI